MAKTLMWIYYHSLNNNTCFLRSATWFWVACIFVGVGFLGCCVCSCVLLGNIFASPVGRAGLKRGAVVLVVVTWEYVLLVF